MVVFLDAPPEVLLDRKPERSLEELWIHRQFFETLIGESPGLLASWTVDTATGGLPAVPRWLVASVQVAAHRWYCDAEALIERIGESFEMGESEREV